MIISGPTNIAFFIPASRFTPENTWTFANLPTGSYIVSATDTFDRFYCVDKFGYVRYSNDGLNWTLILKYNCTNLQTSTTPSNSISNWSWCACSNTDVNKAVICNYGGYIYKVEKMNCCTSTINNTTTACVNDFNIIEKTNSQQKKWTKVTINSDGSKIYAITDSVDYVYRSFDNGSTWFPITTLTKQNYIDMCASPDATKLCVVSKESGLSVSTNMGTGSTFETIL